jgi:hypothetical protein
LTRRLLMLPEAGADEPLSIVRLEYIEWLPTVVVGATILTAVLEPVGVSDPLKFHGLDVMVSGLCVRL